MAGVGKSAVVAGLVRRGWAAIDTDDGWVVPQPDGRQLWDNARLAVELERDPIVVAGCEENMGELVPQFDFVALLVAPLEVMRSRVLDRENPWGKSQAEWDLVVADTGTVLPLLREIADIELDTSVLTVEAIIDTLEEILQAP
jgi:hypothetical protein